MGWSEQIPTALSFPNLLPQYAILHPEVVAVKRGSMEGTVSISGPGYEREGLPNVGAGISGALTAASRRGDGTFYVREDGQVRAWVTVENRVVTVYPVTS